MIRCLVLDDEFLARQLLESYVHKLPFLELVGLCETPFEALDMLQREKVDLLFIDINMPGLNGINFIRTLKNKPEIIITTAYSEHALEGYQLDVIEYLLKPIYFERFLQAVNKSKSMIELKSRAGKDEHYVPEVAVNANVAKTREDHYLFIKTGSQKISKIYLDDIVYIESLHEYVRIHLKNLSYTIYHSLKSLLTILPANQFLQIHRSYIINFHKLEVVEGNTIKVSNIELSIGKNYRDHFLNLIKSNSIGILTHGHGTKNNATAEKKV